mmetsp:Transcript_4221/g.6384  ORF Transcript_4221/g.6384 Transcript_4221/m.6384 type:complete len:98 (-) Transcript_4221:1264-1557(-)
MSRSALWRQEANVKERHRHAQDVWERVLEEGRSNARNKGVLPLVNTQNFGFPPMLLQNISTSPYFINKCCLEIENWNALVDEIFYNVTHVEPWAAGE